MCRYELLVRRLDRVIHLVDKRNLNAEVTIYQTFFRLTPEEVVNSKLQRLCNGIPSSRQF